jgi:peroxiredoxin
MAIESTATTPQSNQKDILFWSEMRTVTDGISITELTENGPVLLVFLRFFGCSFCREAINEIAKRKAHFDGLGVQIVMVHMAAEKKIAEQFFKKYKLWPVHHVSDPEKRFYQAFGLMRGTPQQLFGLMNWIRGFQAGIVEGHGFAGPSEELGDGFQMPGVFLLQNGKIINSYIHNHAWDQPDYDQIVDACLM